MLWKKQVETFNNIVLWLSEANERVGRKVKLGLLISIPKNEVNQVHIYSRRVLVTFDDNHYFLKIRVVSICKNAHVNTLSPEKT